MVLLRVLEEDCGVFGEVDDFAFPLGFSQDITLAHVEDHFGYDISVGDVDYFVFERKCVIIYGNSGGWILTKCFFE